MHSIAMNAMYVDGVTPPSTPAIWFFDKLRESLSTIVCDIAKLT